MVCMGLALGLGGAMGRDVIAESTPPPSGGGLDYVEPDELDAPPMLVQRVG
jgi:hypothetical protein